MPDTIRKRRTKFKYRCERCGLVIDRVPMRFHVAHVSSKWDPAVDSLYHHCKDGACGVVKLIGWEWDTSGALRKPKALKPKGDGS